MEISIFNFSLMFFYDAMCCVKFLNNSGIVTLLFPQSAGITRLLYLFVQSYNYICIYIYIYIYTMVPVSDMKGLSETRFCRKPNVCPVTDAKCRKPVLAGLRRNNEMKIFGFRRCYQ